MLISGMVYNKDSKEKGVFTYYGYTIIIMVPSPMSSHGIIGNPLTSSKYSKHFKLKRKLYYKSHQMTLDQYKDYCIIYSIHVNADRRITQLAFTDKQEDRTTCIHRQTGGSHDLHSQTNGRITRLAFTDRQEDHTTCIHR